MYSYVFVVFLNGLLFATIVPFIPVFIALYFWVKYLVDKNNLLFMYVKKYESGGMFRTSALRYMILNTVFYLLAISSLFGTMIGHFYITIIGFFMIAVVGIILYFFLVDGIKVEEDKLVGIDALKTASTVKIDVVAQSDAEKEKVKAHNIKLLINSYMHPFLLDLKED